MASNSNLQQTTAFETIRFMSYNIRWANPNDGYHVWKNRKHLVGSMIHYHKAEIACLQEALIHQLRDLMGYLPDYDWIGVGRDDGKESGELVPILYNRKKFKVVEHGHFWISQTPSTPGSKSWNTACTRMCTWGLFKYKLQDGQPPSDTHQFYVFNLHLDHVSEAARVEGIKLVLAQIALKTQNTVPSILLGDFNCDESSATVKLITGTNPASYPMQNTKYLSLTGHLGPVETHTGFHFEEKILIDHIFLHKGNKSDIQVLTHGTLSDTWENDYQPSDHRPVITDLLVKW